MKKTFVLLLALGVLLAVMTGCGGKNGPEEKANDGYVVIVTDTDNAAVEDVDLQLCQDDLCLKKTTDEAGYAKFETEQGDYTLHVLSVPDGFAEDDTEYEVSGSYGVTMITLKPSE